MFVDDEEKFVSWVRIFYLGVYVVREGILAVEDIMASFVLRWILCFMKFWKYSPGNEQDRFGGNSEFVFNRQST